MRHRPPEMARHGSRWLGSRQPTGLLFGGGADVAWATRPARPGAGIKHVPPRVTRTCKVLHTYPQAVGRTLIDESCKDQGTLQPKLAVRVHVALIVLSPEQPIYELSS